jgi:hypothetical protein
MPDNDGTVGELWEGDEWICFTLEDVERVTKIPGETAIPLGTYEIIVTPSPRFKRPLPLLIDVPNFDGIRIHPGNTTLDTDGCILVGSEFQGEVLGQSQAAFDPLFARIQDAKSRGEKVTIEITNG